MGRIYIVEAMCPKNHPCPTARRCPQGAIIQNSPYEAPKVDETKCTECGYCTNTCQAFQCKDC